MTVRQIIAYAEINWLVHKGLNLKASYDFFDPDRSQSGDEEERIGVGGELTPMPYMQIRLFWRKIDRPSQVRELFFEDEREIVAELHIFL